MVEYTLNNCPIFWDHLTLLITKRDLPHTRVVITQLLFVSGNLLLNRGMLVPSTIWVRCTAKEKVFLRTIRLR